MPQNDGVKQTAIPAPTLEDPVAKAERELRKAQEELAEAKEAAKRDEEIDKVVAQYKAAWDALHAKQGNLETTCQTDIEWLAVTDAEKAAVETARGSAQQPVDQAETVVDRADANLNKARKDLTDAKQERDEAQAGFEAIKSQAKLVEARHRAADAIAKDAADARCKGHKLLAYDLLQYNLSEAIEGDPQPIEVAAFEIAIRAASTRLAGLNRAVSDLEAAIKAGERALADAEKALSESQKAFEPALRAKLTALTQPQPEPAS